MREWKDNARYLMIKELRMLTCQQTKRIIRELEVTPRF